MLNYRAEHACGLIKDSNGLTTVIVIGGYDKYVQKTFATTEYLDFNTNKWVSGPGLPYQMAGPVIVPNPAGGILLVGGVESSSVPLRKTIISLSSLTSTWTNTSSSLKIGRYAQVTLPFPYSNITTCTCKKNEIFQFKSLKVVTCLKMILVVNWKRLKFKLESISATNFSQCTQGLM